MSNIRENNTDDHGAFVILQGERNQNLQFWIIAILALEPEDLNPNCGTFPNTKKLIWVTPPICYCYKKISSSIISSIRCHPCIVW